MDAKLPLLLLLIIGFAIEFPDGKRCCSFPNWLCFTIKGESKTGAMLSVRNRRAEGISEFCIGEAWFAMLFAVASQDDIATTPAGL